MEGASTQPSFGQGAQPALITSIPRKLSFLTLLSQTQ